MEIIMIRKIRAIVIMLMCLIFALWIGIDIIIMLTFIMVIVVGSFYFSGLKENQKEGE